MASFNKVILLGNLTRDPEQRALPNGSSVVNFGLAMSRKFTVNDQTKEETCFIDITAFGKLGDVVAQYCHKGSPLFVEGRLKQDQWTDKESGAKRSKIGVIAESIQLLGGRGQGSGSAPASEPADPAFNQPADDGDVPF